MDKLLQLITFGLKNIEKPLVLDFANQTIKNGLNKVNTIKGIYGYNGAGKTALITSADIYRKITTDSNFLVQNSTQELLKELINKKTKKFYFSSIFAVHDDVVIKHSIELIKDNKKERVIISNEKFEVSRGRTLNEKFSTLISRDTDSVSVNDDLKEKYPEIFANVEPLDSSFVPVFIRKLLVLPEYINFDNKKIDGLSALACFYVDMNETEVLTLKSDELSYSRISKKEIMELVKKTNILFNSLNTDSDIFYLNDDRVNVIKFKQYEKLNRQLFKFIQIFKPELIDIKLEKILDKDIYHIRKYFVYKDYSVEFSYESSGIKQLVNLYSYLKKCADGRLVFIDEMDVNINAVYFKKLVSYFANFGKGQLIFTTHNIESMDAIKNQRRSISVIGSDGEVDTWVSIGNRSPIKDYFGGYFKHSPMNVEDFDFISIFEGED